MGIRSQRSEKGAAAVEFALVMPLLLLLVFGIIEFGFVFNRYISVTHAAREGVRELALGVPVAQATADAANSSPNTGGGVVCVASEATVAANDIQESMACQTTYAYSYVPGLVGHTVTLRSTARMKRE
jgi:Flp pilus assembly protein TadG